MTLALFSLLGGVVLAQRFKILVMVPATALTLVIAAGLGTARDDAAWWTALMAVAAATGLQMGYMFGLVIHRLPVLSQTSHTVPPSSSAATRRGAH